MLYVLISYNTFYLDGFAKLVKLKVISITIYITKYCAMCLVLVYHKRITS